MNKNKLKQLFESVRNESAPAPPPDFAADVLRAVRREPPAELKGGLSIFDQLNLLFPRIALASAAVVILCVTADFGLTVAGVPGLSGGVLQISAQWLLTPNGF